MNYLLLMLFVFSNVLYVYSAPILLQKALADNIIELKIAVDTESPHYNAPFLFHIKNNTNQKQEILIETGFSLIADNVDEQNFIITQEQLLVLDANRNITKPIYAMCIERNDAAPEENSTYQLGAKATDNLCRLSEFISLNKNFEPDAQFLIWDLAEALYSLEKHDYFRINEFGEVEIVRLNAEGKESVVNQKLETEMPMREIKVSGNFEMNLASVKKIHIAMFNMNNVLVKELYNNPETPKGPNKVEYAFNSLEFPDEKYQIKLVMNGRVMMNRVVLMDI